VYMENPYMYMDVKFHIHASLVENPLLYANFTALSFTEPELLPIEFLHCGKRELHIFL